MLKILESLRFLNKQKAIAVAVNYLLYKLHIIQNFEYDDEIYLLSELKNFASALYVKSNNICVEHMLHGKRITTFLRKTSSDVRVFRQIFVWEEYSQLISIIGKRGLQVKSIVDCGANIGLFSQYMRGHFQEANITMVEPDSQNINQISANMIEDKHIRVIQAGVWSSDSFLRTRNNFRDGLEWSIQVEETESSDLQGLTIQSVANQSNFKLIDILKVDIEGAEAELFSDQEDAAKFLSITKLICIEVHPEHISEQEVEAVLTSCDFDVTSDGEFLIGVNRRLV